MRKAIILHGKPSKEGYYNPNRESQSNEHWIPWLQHELIIRDILTQTPEWPKPYEPDYKEWLKTFNQFEVDGETILIGHSCGGGFLVRWLSENNVKVGKVYLIAPSLNPRQTINGFYDFDMDSNLVAKTRSVTIYGSTNDDKSIKDSIKTLRDTIKDVKYREFKDYGHFCFNDMKSREFPELLKEVL